MSNTLNVYNNLIDQINGVIHPALDDTFYNLCRIKVLVFIILYIIHMNILNIGDVPKIKSEKEKKIDTIIDLKNEHKIIDLRINKIFYDGLDEYDKFIKFMNLIMSNDIIILEFIEIRYVYKWFQKIFKDKQTQLNITPLLEFTAVDMTNIETLSVLNTNTQLKILYDFSKKNKDAINIFMGFAHASNIYIYDKNIILNIVYLLFIFIILDINIVMIVKKNLEEFDFIYTEIIQKLNLKDNVNKFKEIFKQLSDEFNQFKIIYMFITKKNQIIDLFEKKINDLKYDEILFQIKYENLQMLYDIFLRMVKESDSIKTLLDKMIKGSSTSGSGSGSGGRSLKNIFDDFNKDRVKYNMDYRYNIIVEEFKNINIKITQFNEQLKTKTMTNEQLLEFINQKNEINEQITNTEKISTKFLNQFHTIFKNIIHNK